jgi:hypothetical protein
MPHLVPRQDPAGHQVAHVTSFTALAAANELCTRADVFFRNRDTTRVGVIAGPFDLTPKSRQP